MTYRANEGPFTAVGFSVLPNRALAGKALVAYFTPEFVLCEVLGLMGFHFLVGVEALKERTARRKRISEFSLICELAESKPLSLANIANNKSNKNVFGTFQGELCVDEPNNVRAGQGSEIY